MTLDYTKMFLIVTEEAVVKGHFDFTGISLRKGRFFIARRGNLQFVEVLSGEAAYLLPGRRWMPEGQTEVERRYLKYGKKSIQMQKRNIFARIPLPTSLTLGHLPPGGRYMERYVSSRQTEI